MYGLVTFGQNAADFFFEEILRLVNNLSNQYYFHPECRYLPTKSHKYRNIILGSYLIVYRVKTKIEVLRAFHSSHSPKIYHDLKKIQL
ncbi:type II toxin-antitoxin system RelE/ParE family toxin [Flavobacterium sp. NST-5]|uniref:Type II toxin-antitoxin system RelE/ParE family toxin n=1 Tax=Flavobacterium ichthyis TaxID=2698827 RepID=A0ABW9Z6X4_9FLAO|nr:type II toxin-antitoxin system RelE/ParE family toxin [Flavobacterium ichthyis]